MNRGPALRHVVELAPETVTRISTGDAYRPPRGERTPPLSRRLPARLLLRVPEAALLLALDLAGGDPSRLRIAEDGTVTIANSARPGTDPRQVR